jgi:hypothetical protein
LSYAIGATSQSVDVSVYDDDGLPVTGLVAATFPTVKYSKAGANADVSITLADLAAIGTAWASGGLKERGEGVYRLDLPNAVFSTASKVKIRGEDTDKRLLFPLISVGDSEAVADAVEDALTGAELTLQSAFTGGSLTIHKGAEYSTANDNTVDFDFTTLPDLTGGTARFHCRRVNEATPFIDVSLSITNPGTATQTIVWALAATESTKVKPPEQCVGTLVYKTATAVEYAPAREFPAYTRWM